MILRSGATGMLRACVLSCVIFQFLGGLALAGNQAGDKPPEEENQWWAVCLQMGSEYTWGCPGPQPGIYCLNAENGRRIPRIMSSESKFSFPYGFMGSWMGTVPGPQYVVVSGYWESRSDSVHVAIDKSNPLALRTVPRKARRCSRFAWLDQKWQVLNLKSNGPEHSVYSFDPETMNVVKVGKEAWGHVLSGGVSIQEGKAVFRRVPSVSLQEGIPSQFMIEGQHFGIHWNDDDRVVLLTRKPGHRETGVLICHNKRNHESRTFEYARGAGIGAFRVTWPWLIYGYPCEESNPSRKVVRDWRVFNIKSEEWGKFTLEVEQKGEAPDNKGLDIIDDVMFWAVDEELMAVDLREVVEKEGTDPHLVWRDPLVSLIHAIFPAQDGYETEVSVQHLGTDKVSNK
jgi:hypothetical protein